VDAELPQLLSAVDTALTDVMRRVLHDPAFQDVEATWRGIHWLVSSLELGEDLELYLLHVTRDELSRGAGPESDLYQRLVDREARTAGGLQFSAAIGVFHFGATLEDLSVLDGMGGLGRALGAPFVAGCGASLLGATAAAEHPDPRDWKPLAPDVDGKWRALRASDAARHLGLAFPRFMLRRPYGDRSDRIEAFRFEEQPPRPEHGAFLWGHPAFACAAVLARVLVSDEDAQDLGDVGGLPTFAWVGDEETRLQPCTEVSLSERAIDATLTRGIMPLVGFKDRDVARLVRLQSIADPPTPLGG
jgi:type VI secretion system protein ImpC